MQQKLLQSADIFEAIGYLANPNASMRFDVQVPSGKQEEFENDYRMLTGDVRPDLVQWDILY